MENVFQEGIKAKVRFEEGARGLFSTEDLYGLSLETLNTIAKAVNKKIKEEGEEDFIGSKSKSTKTLDLKLAILKAVIADKIEARDKAKNNAINLARLKELRTIAGTKAAEALQGQSLEDINKMISEIESQMAE